MYATVAYRQYFIHTRKNGFSATIDGCVHNTRTKAPPFSLLKKGKKCSFPARALLFRMKMGVQFQLQAPAWPARLLHTQPRHGMRQGRGYFNGASKRVLSNYVITLRVQHNKGLH
jgi:hypothetical protein